MIKIIECPRDAMQGIHDFIPTAVKIQYINRLLQVGFDTIDFGSFVSPKAIPQMRDTAEVLQQLNWKESSSKLLAIVANTRGAEEASQFDAISYLGFPLSISETFQKRNTNKSIVDALNTLEEIQNICKRTGKELVTYISMGFGNPYGDPYHVDQVAQFVDILSALQCKIVSLADTIGVSTPENIQSLFTSLTRTFPDLEIGVHLHSAPALALEKINAAYSAGCKRIDGALRGYGGCPMAKDDLVGNIATESVLAYLQEHGVVLNLDMKAFAACMQMADEIFPKH
jgi:hydroxymethylglutaryl-CoA lyase